MYIASIKRQLNNIFHIGAIDFFPLLKKYFIFLLDYRFRNGTSRYPINITFELTYRCNLKCSFCFLKESVLNKSIEQEEINIEDIRNVLKEVKKFKPSIYLTGGEPLIRKDLVDIIRLVKSYRLRCGLNTNGTLLNKEKIKRIVKSSLDYIIVSVDKPYKISNIRDLTHYKKRPKVFINYVVCKESMEGLNKLINYAKEMKVDGVILQHLSFLTKKDITNNKIFCDKFLPNHNCSYLKSYPLKDEIKIKLFNQLNKVKEYAKKKNIFLMSEPVELSKEGLFKWYSDNFLFLNKCKYVWNGARISPYGEIYPCFSYRMVMGNIKYQKFFYIWNNEKFVNFRKLLKEKGVFPGCNRCCKI